MDIGKRIFVDVSQATITALKIVAIICLIMLCTQIVKAMPMRKCNGGCGKKKIDFFDSKLEDNKKQSDEEREKERKYWKSVRDELGKKESVNEKEKKRMEKMVSDKNIKIKPKSKKVDPIVKIKENPNKPSEKKPSDNPKNKSKKQ